MNSTLHIGLETVLRFHTINEEVKTKGNAGTQLLKAGNYVRSLGVFRARDIVTAGYTREYLRRLVGQKQVRQIGRGLYASASFDGDHNLSLVKAAKKVPRGVVCLISALQFHRIGTQSPHQVWLALPRGTNFPSSGNLPFRFCKFSKASYSFGVEEHSLPGGTVRIYSPAKTVADCFKYRHKYGLDVAVEALREGWQEKKFTMNDLTKAAAVCRVSRVIQPYLEMLT
ncbi:MAG: type IV toxin-antitoxin system AbiEi family antitoxin domain-containing protein [Opitutaceae bacterium]